MAVIIIKGTIFLFFIGPGLLGNIFVFVNFLCIFYGGNKKKYIHLIFLHLTFMNIMMLFCKGLAKTIATFGLRNFLRDAGCQIVVYLERMSRGLSICTTSLLTTVQAITMSPRSSMLTRFKPRSAWHLLPFFFCFWIISFLVSMNLFYYIRNVSGLNKSVINDNDSYCDFIADSQITKWIFLTFMALRDGLFQILMGWASVYILFLLRKHHQQVLHLRDSRLVPKMAPEIRAARSVLLLMFCFLFFYWTETVASLYLRSNFENQTIALNALDVLSLGYAALSPIILIHRESSCLAVYKFHPT